MPFPGAAGLALWPMLTTMEVTGRTYTARLQRAVGWFGVAFFAALALVATAYLLFDTWRVATHISSLASVRVALVSAVVILVAAVLVAVMTWFAGRSPRGATVVTVVALLTLVLVRVVIAVAYDGVLSGEPGIYTRLAANMAAGDCCLWDTAIDRPPGYVLILAAAFAVGGQTPAVAEGLNIAMALATGLFVLALARRLYGPRVGAVAVLLYAIWPAGALMITAALPHTSYELAIAAGAWAVVAGPRGWKGSALAGGILGLSQYLRPTTMLLLPIFLAARTLGRWSVAGLHHEHAGAHVAWHSCWSCCPSWPGTSPRVAPSTSAPPRTAARPYTTAPTSTAAAPGADKLLTSWPQPVAMTPGRAARRACAWPSIARWRIRWPSPRWPSESRPGCGAARLTGYATDPPGARQPTLPAQFRAAVAGQRHLLCGPPGAHRPGPVAPTPAHGWPFRVDHRDGRDAIAVTRTGRGA